MIFLHLDVLSLPRLMPRGTVSKATCLYWWTCPGGNISVPCTQSTRFTRLHQLSLSLKKILFLATSFLDKMAKRIKAGYIKRANDSDSGRKEKLKNKNLSLEERFFDFKKAVQLSRQREEQAVRRLLTDHSDRDALPQACRELKGALTMERLPPGAGVTVTASTHQAGGWAEAGRTERPAGGLKGRHGSLWRSGCSRPPPACCTAPAAVASPRRRQCGPRGLARTPVAEEADLNHHALCGYSC